MSCRILLTLTGCSILDKLCDFFSLLLNQILGLYTNRNAKNVVIHAFNVMTIFACIHARMCGGVFSTVFVGKGA